MAKKTKTKRKRITPLSYLLNRTFGRGVKVGYAKAKATMKKTRNNYKNRKYKKS